MVKQLCGACGVERAVLKRPKTFEQLCRPCFYAAFEEEVHQTIVANKLFKCGERVAIAASGGKDSTVLAHIMTLLNQRHHYGLDLFLLSIDEGITGYRDDSLETVKTNEQTYGIPLTVLSYKDLYGWTMDEIVRQIGKKNNCTFCGVFRRQALDRGGVLCKADKIVTGHNADDIAETVLLNILRGDLPRLSRCAAITTGEDSALPRCKPFKYAYEKEIVMYAYFKKLVYFSTECIYAPFAARGFARDFIKDLELARPRAILDVIHSAETFRIGDDARDGMVQPRSCTRCGYICSQPICKACVLLEGLNSGVPQLGVSRTRGKGGRKAGLPASVSAAADERNFSACAAASLLAPPAADTNARVKPGRASHDEPDTPCTCGAGRSPEAAEVGSSCGEQRGEAGAEAAEHGRLKAERMPGQGDGGPISTRSFPAAQLARAAGGVVSQTSSMSFVGAQTRKLVFEED